MKLHMQKKRKDLWGLRRRWLIGWLLRFAPDIATSGLEPVFVAPALDLRTPSRPTRQTWLKSYLLSLCLFAVT